MEVRALCSAFRVSNLRRLLRSGRLAVRETIFGKEYEVSLILGREAYSPYISLSKNRSFIGDRVIHDI